MRTTQLGVFVSLVSACAPIGGTDQRTPRPDAGTSASGCDNEQAVQEDWSITTPDGFGNVPTGCYHLDGRLTLSTNAITSIAKLGDIRGVRDLEINNTALTKLDSQSPILVSGSLTIKSNGKLTSLANLTIDGTQNLSAIDIEANGALTDLGEISQASIVTGATIVANNAKLVTLDLSQLTRAQGGLSIHDNALLTTVKVPALESVTGDMSIRNNAVLSNLGSWSALEFIHGELVIDTNPKLTSLDQAMTQPMTEIFKLTINNNAALTSLGQLDHTGYFDTTFTITNNPQLNYCVIREVGCCVSHTGDTISGNLGTSCNYGAHSWCYANNTCPYTY